MRRKPGETGNSSSKGRGKGKKGLQDHRIPEVQGWDVGAGRPYMDPTEEAQFWQQKRSGDQGDTSWRKRKSEMGRRGGDGRRSGKAGERIQKGGTGDGSVDRYEEGRVKGGTG